MARTYAATKHTDLAIETLASKSPGLHHIRNAQIHCAQGSEGPLTSTSCDKGAAWPRGICLRLDCLVFRVIFLPASGPLQSHRSRSSELLLPFRPVTPVDVSLAGLICQFYTSYPGFRRGDARSSTGPNSEDSVRGEDSMNSLEVSYVLLGWKSPYPDHWFINKP